MNRSYSKIRHIQKSNLLLESRLLNEHDPNKMYPASDNLGDNSRWIHEPNWNVPKPAPKVPRLPQQVAKADYRSAAERAANTKETERLLSLKNKLDQQYGNRHILADNPQSQSSYNLDKHTALTVLSIGAAFIPFAGPFLSAGIQLYDAYLYGTEGDPYMAGMMGMFALIPGSSVLGKLIPSVSKLTIPELKVLSKKMIDFSKAGKAPIVNSIEGEVIEQVAKNSDEIARVAKETAKQTAETTTNAAIKPTLIELAKSGLKITKQVGKEVAYYGSAAVGYNATYDAIQRSTPFGLVTSDGFDFNKVVLAFGSNTSEFDNTQLYLAWKEGWRPGTVVPEKYQTETYKKLYKQETEDFAALEALASERMSKTSKTNEQ